MAHPEHDEKLLIQFNGCESVYIPSENKTKKLVNIISKEVSIKLIVNKTFFEGGVF